MTRHARSRIAVAVAFLGVLLVTVAPACGGTSAQCSTFCERWHDCVDSNVDEDACEDRCTDWAEDNSDRESKVDKCDECLSQNDACSDAERRCALDCLGIPVR